MAAIAAAGSTTTSDKMIIDFNSERHLVKGTLTPYTDATQCKKISRGRVKRPMNAFMVWSQLERRRITAQSPNATINNAQLSKQLGARWALFDADAKQPFIEESRRLHELHALEFPDYKYRPRKKGKVVGGATATATDTIKTRRQRAPPPPRVKSEKRQRDGAKERLAPLNSSGGVVDSAAVTRQLLSASSSSPPDDDGIIISRPDSTTDSGFDKSEPSPALPPDLADLRDLVHLGTTSPMASSPLKSELISWCSSAVDADMDYSSAIDFGGDLRWPTATLEHCPETLITGDRFFGFAGCDNDHQGAAMAQFNSPYAGGINQPVANHYAQRDCFPL